MTQTIITFFFTVFISFNASAAPVFWTLSGADFADQSVYPPVSDASLSGTFIYDADTDIFSEVNLVVSGGTMDGFLFDALNKDPVNEQYITGSTSNNPDGYYLWFYLGAPFTNTGGHIALLDGEFGDINCNYCTYVLPGSTATFHAVPLPASIWLFGSAIFAFMGFARYRSH
jgi:hypothetical protein